MKLIRLIGLVSILSVAAFGQRGGFRGGFGGGFRGGFGGGFRGGFGGFHGGFVGGGFRGGFIGGGLGFGGFRGFRTFPSHRFFFGSSFFFNRPFFSPGFIYPWGWGGGWGWGSPFFDSGFYDYPAYNYAPAPNTTVIYLPPAPGGPEYISQQSYTPDTARPVIREYGQSASKPISFSLARRDGTVVQAAAFWIEGGTVNYIDMEGRSRTLPFADIDRDRSEKLNRDRGLEFRLPESPR